MKTKSIFITATGTDVGKTYISALLVKKMKELGLNCGYYKPVLSGAIKSTDGLLPGDCNFVIETAKLDVAPLDCVSYCFEEAISPHLASVRQGVRIKKDVIKKDYTEISNKYDYLIVEGAGGITCPLNLENEKLLLSDVINYLNIDIVIVADAGLGTINSVILTVEYAKAHNINIKGIIFNNFDKNNFMHIDNKKQVEILTAIPVVACVKKGENDLSILKPELLEIFD